MKDLDLNEDGHVSEGEYTQFKDMLDELEDLEPEDVEPDDVEPPTVHTAPPIRLVSTIGRAAPPTVHTAPPVRLASPIVHATPPTKACPTCPHPSVHNPNWNKLELLNDTRKNINGFKLFAKLDAPPSEFPSRFAVHVREHEGRKDIWNAKLFPAVVDEAIREMEAESGMSYTQMKNEAPPEGKAFFASIEAFNSHQPRWNLADNRLETRSNDSAPVNDTLYFRLFENKDVKDTSNIVGPVYRSVLTTNPNKNKYDKERKAKLVGKKSWQLKRDPVAPWDYTLLNKDIDGNFFWCVEQGKMAALKAKAMDRAAEVEAIEADARNGQFDLQAAQALISEAHQILGDHEGTELRFMNSKEKTVRLNKGETTCMAVTLKVR